MAESRWTVAADAPVGGESHRVPSFCIMVLSTDDASKDSESSRVWELRQSGDRYIKFKADEHITRICIEKKSWLFFKITLPSLYEVRQRIK